MIKGQVVVSEHHSRTSRYIFQQVRQSLNLRQSDPVPTWTGGTVKRLQGLVSTKDPSYPQELAGFLAKTEAKILFDTSLFDASTPDCIWDAVFSSPGKLGITRAVYEELQPWINDHPYHRASRALTNAFSSIEKLGITGFDHQCAVAGRCYHVLLCLRKFALHSQIMKFEEAHGRLPNEAEMDNIRAYVQRYTSERGMLIARKGKDIALERQDPLAFTDEDLVVVSCLKAIQSGQETILLTKDEDVAEQFLKLTTLLECHYRSMWVADWFAASPQSFDRHDIPWELSRRYEECFDQSKENFLIDVSSRIVDASLPQQWEPIPVTCFVAGDQYTWVISFCFEFGFRRLLDVKGATAGLNTDVLGGRNCHMWLGPTLPRPNGLWQPAAIAADHRFDYDDQVRIELPILDVDMATGVEQFVASA